MAKMRCGWSVKVGWKVFTISDYEWGYTCIRDRFAICLYFIGLQNKQKVDIEALLILF
jgi:lysozyme family protein